MRPIRQFIAGLEGEVLSTRERELFAAERPAGFILFARNIRDRAQLLALTASLQALDPERTVPILVDQEGGRVARLRPPLCADLPPQGAIGAVHEENPAEARALAYALGRVIAASLDRSGINVDCAPCLDVAQPQVTWAIGDRAFSRDPDVVAVLGRQTMQGLVDGGVVPVIKHMPGHGRATCDSHLELPHVGCELGELRKTDFVPFKALNDAPMGMTCHLLFHELDENAPATQSRTVIQEIIRGEIGFQGILLSDDLSMRALAGGIEERAMRSLEAGVDLPLHCNGNAGEIGTLMAAMPLIPDTLLDHLTALMARGVRSDDGFDIVRATEDLQKLGRVYG